MAASLLAKARCQRSLSQPLREGAGKGRLAPLLIHCRRSLQAALNAIFVVLKGVGQRCCPPPPSVAGCALSRSRRPPCTVACFALLASAFHCLLAYLITRAVLAITAPRSTQPRRLITMVVITRIMCTRVTTMPRPHVFMRGLEATIRGRVTISRREAMTGIVTITPSIGPALAPATVMAGGADRDVDNRGGLF